MIYGPRLHESKKQRIYPPCLSPALTAEAAGVVSLVSREVFWCWSLGKAWQLWSPRFKKEMIIRPHFSLMPVEAEELTQQGKVMCSFIKPSQAKKFYVIFFLFFFYLSLSLSFLQGGIQVKRKRPGKVKRLRGTGWTRVFLRQDGWY